MKKYLQVLALIVLSLTGLNTYESKAQGSVAISGWGGYMLTGKVRYYEGDFNMHDGPTYGGSIGFEVAQNNWGYISYSNTSTTADFIPYVSGYMPWRGDIGINYIQIGSIHGFDFGSPIVPFLGGSLGATILNIKETNISDVWRFSVGLTGGLDFNISESVALRFQARMLMPMYFAGMGFYVGIGTGGASSGLSMNAGVIALQGDFTGGLVFKFNK
jgi:opacity protein-like surface antigen